MQGQQGALAQPGHGLMIVVAVLVVLAVAVALFWWERRTRGGRRAP